MKNDYTYSPLDRVIWDTPSLEAIESEIERLNAKKVFIKQSSKLLTLAWTLWPLLKIVTCITTVMAITTVTRRPPLN